MTSCVKKTFVSTFSKQECIPVGCIPPAAVAVMGGGSPHTPHITPPSGADTALSLPPEQASPPQAGTPPCRIPLNFPLWCGPGDSPPGQICLNFALGCGPGNLQGMLGYHPLETCCKACWDTTCNACWDSTPPCWQTHTCKNITFANYVCGR